MFFTGLPQLSLSKGPSKLANAKQESSIFLHSATGATLSSTFIHDQQELPLQISINLAITLVPACSAVTIAFGITFP